MPTPSGWSINQTPLLEFMQTQDNARSGIAALSFLVWDIIISLGQEVEYIWWSTWTPLKLLFFFTRYYSLAILVLLNTRTLTCKQWIIIEATSAVVLELAVEILLILRIYAMYSGNRFIISSVIVLLVVQIIVMIATVTVSMLKATTSTNCATVIPMEMMAYTIASILYEAFLFTLAVLKLRSTQKMGVGRVSLIRVLIRDNMWTFMAIFAVMTVNAVFFTLAPASLAAIGFPWVLAILGILGPRLMLNVRREHKRRSMPSTNFSSISFVHYSPVFNPGPWDPD